jgi:hypothetical protein
MARSFKHTPVFRDHRDKEISRRSNKVVRHSEVVGDGSAYRKLYCSYNLHDWTFHYWDFTDDKDYDRAARK